MGKIKIATAIDIGSSAVRMHISQWDGKKIVELDRLEKPSVIGKEAFSTGYISYETVSTLSEALSGFSEKAHEYGITNIQVTASTALREASNQAYILDHLATRNNLDVRVLEDSEVSALIMNAMKGSENPESSRVLHVYGGTGTIDFELVQDGKTLLAHSIGTGLLKLTEMMREAADFSSYAETMQEQYLHIHLQRGNRIQDLFEADAIVFGAADLQPFYRMSGIAASDGAGRIPGELLLQLYESHHRMSLDQIGRQYGIDAEQAGFLLAILSLLTILMRLTGVGKIALKEINLADAMLGLMLQPGERRRYNESLKAGTIAAAMDLAARYGCDLVHSRYVADTSLQLFQELKGLHGLTKKHSHYLQVACILHEAGYSTNSALKIDSASFNLVRDVYMYGLCRRETLLCASIIAPHNLSGIAHVTSVADMLSREEALFTAKLHAIMRLTDILDYSHRQKGRICDVTLEGTRLVIGIRVCEDFTLEQLMFRQGQALFEEVFGITPELRITRVTAQQEDET